MTNDNTTETKKPAKVKKRKGHVGLILLVIVALVLAAIAGLAFRVPQKIDRFIRLPAPEGTDHQDPASQPSREPMLNADC